jgi:hypothetical protein
MLSMYSSPVMGRADVLFVGCSMDIVSSAGTDSFLNAIFGVIDISATFANAFRSVLLANLNGRRLDVVSPLRTFVSMSAHCNFVILPNAQT